MTSEETNGYGFVDWATSDFNNESSAIDGKTIKRARYSTYGKTARLILTFTDDTYVNLDFEVDYDDLEVQCRPTQTIPTSRNAVEVQAGLVTAEQADAERDRRNAAVAASQEERERRQLADLLNKYGKDTNKT